MYTDEQILALFDNCYLEDLSEYNISQIYFSLNFEKAGISENISYYFCNGASKAAMIINDWDWVVKIPFMYGEGYSYWEHSWEDSQGIRHSGSYNQGTDQFYGANNAENGWDYCLKEVENYQAAKERGLEEFFAEIKRIGFTSRGYPIYLQKKAEIEQDSLIKKRELKLSSSEKEISEAKSISCEHDDWLDWPYILLAIQKRGREKAVQLISFIKDFCIGDLYNRNIGYYDNSFVLVDYSDFNS